MKKGIIALAVILIISAAVYGLYPPLVKKRQVEAALQEFAAAVATKDRTQVNQSLATLLSDAAKIHLEVQRFLVTQPDISKSALQDFDKPAFILFVDNVLFTMTDYDYAAELADFTLDADKKSASVRFISHEWADGPEHYAGVAVNMRFSSDTECSGRVVLQRKSTQIEELSCVQHLRIVPKPEEAFKMQQNPEVMRQFLR